MSFQTQISRRSGGPSWLRFASICTAALGLMVSNLTAGPAISTTGGLPTPYDLRCDWIVNPLGVDSSKPELSWKLRGKGRGIAETAWQVLVASSPENLSADKGDIWDSGKVAGDTQLEVPYGGPNLKTADQVFWKVRVWNKKDKVSAWSKPAHWTMGIVSKDGWKGHWITDKGLLSGLRTKLGFSTHPTAKEDTEKWVELDLGKAYPISTVHLLAVTHGAPERLGFPLWFKVEASTSPDFKNATVMVDHTKKPFGNKWSTSITVPGKGVQARYIRVVATKLRMTSEQDFADSGEPAAGKSAEPVGRLAFSQIEVISGGKNVAVGATVTASDSLKTEHWSNAALVDGLGVPGQNPRANETIRLRRDFKVKAGLKRALFYVCGLGGYRLEVDGATANLNSDLLTPGWTVYSKTCLYDTRDITSMLHPGENAVGLTLAGGMYNVQHYKNRYVKFTSQFRPLKAIGQIRLEYNDGTVETIPTDTQWQVQRGPITYANVYGGEDYDARLDSPDWATPGASGKGWASAAETDGPGGKLLGASHAAPPISVHETFKPVKVTRIRRGVDVYDFGQNASLMIDLRVKGPRGSKVKIIPAELVNKDGSADTSSLHPGHLESSWNYTLSGAKAGESWQPRLFYHGARYLQVEVQPAAGSNVLPKVQSLQGLVVGSDSQPVGDFACSDELFNRIRMLVRWAQRSNMVSILTDCPHRERLGWLEQDHLNGPSLRYEFGLARLYSKIFGDIADSQKASGMVPSIAPDYIHFPGNFGDSPAWGSAFVIAMWQQYVWTGDERPFRRYYSDLKRYFNYLAGKSKDNIVSYGLGDWYDLGPKGPGFAQLTPIPLTGTAFFYIDAKTMSRIAEVLGRKADAASFIARADGIKKAFNDKFFDSATNKYATGSQTAQALPLVLGLVPEDHRAGVLKVLVADVRANGNGVTAGDVGYRYLLQALAENGRSDVIFDMNNQSDKPGYGYQLKKGATSLTESWNANRHSSQNHFMLGQIMEWFYRDLVGIGPNDSGAGYKKIVVRPQPVGDITWAKASYNSVRGLVVAGWTRSDGKFNLSVSIPPNTTAMVYLPSKEGSEVTESGLPAKRSPGVTFVRREDGRAVYSIESGNYTFESQTK